MFRWSKALTFARFRLGLNHFTDGFRSRYKDVIGGVKNQSSFLSSSSRPFLDLKDHLNLKKLYEDGQTRFSFVLLSVAVLLSCNTAPAADERSEEEVRLIYKEWLLKHGKSDNFMDEKGSRFQVFRDNLKFIDKHNAAADAGEHTSWVGLNRFSDLTKDEFRSKCCGLRTTGYNRPVFSSLRCRNEDVSNDSIPGSIAVVGVKDQGSCEQKQTSGCEGTVAHSRKAKPCIR